MPGVLQRLGRRARRLASVLVSVMVLLPAMPAIAQDAASGTVMAKGGAISRQKSEKPGSNWTSPRYDRSIPTGSWRMDAQEQPSQSVASRQRLLRRLRLRIAAVRLARSGRAAGFTRCPIVIR